MSERDNEQSKTIKIVDRRRFNAAGTVRADAGPLSESTRPPAPAVIAADAEQASPAPTQAPRAPAPPPAPRREATPPDAQGEETPRLEFLPFIATLATNAMAALGMMPDARRQGVPKNPAVAREYIDIIIMLEQRTRGNLNAEEAETMTRLVADLKVQYVEATRSVQPIR